jgi:hypothetical protein
VKACLNNSKCPLNVLPFCPLCRSKEFLHLRLGPAEGLDEISIWRIDPVIKPIFTIVVVVVDRKVDLWGFAADGIINRGDRSKMLMSFSMSGAPKLKCQN